MGTRTHDHGRPVNTRRQFFGLVALALAGGALALLPEADGPKLNPIWRKTAAGWEQGECACSNSRRATCSE